MGALEIDFHENGSLIWTWPLTLVASALGVVLIGVSFVVPWTMNVSIAGIVALFVALGGRLSSALELRYADAPLAQIGAPARTARRRWAMRSSGVPLVTAGLGVLLVVAAAGDPLITAFGLAFITFGLVVGPAAGFVVSPRHLHIDTAFWRVSVPRHLIGEFEHSDLDVRLRLRDGDFVDIRVDSPIMEYSSKGYWMNARCRVRTTARIVRMLDAVPPSAGWTAESVGRRRRPVVIGATLVAVAATIILAVHGVLVLAAA
ncbi:hypothetical protein [Paractinoplanes lichenicola]|uniref:Uncharacterized protein n=1 Tax=Paractinoplanes lichenicola TaxID=2802976 RepID=A0ABS1VV14_9ACTN|nr:hypothetical protein [Actinoplanes lichenicola]MBL7258282.1 hypothetical protein [Actinoplanes lichenicola]